MLSRWGVTGCRVRLIIGCSCVHRCFVIRPEAIPALCVMTVQAAALVNALKWRYAIETGT